MLLHSLGLIQYDRAWIQLFMLDEIVGNLKILASRFMIYRFIIYVRYRNMKLWTVKNYLFN